MLSTLHHHAITTQEIDMCENISDNEAQGLSNKESTLVSALLEIYLRELHSQEPFVFLEGKDTSNIVVMPMVGERKIICLDVSATDVVYLKRMVSVGYDDKDVNQRDLVDTIIGLVTYSAYKARPLYISQSSKGVSLNVIESDAS